MQPFHGLQAAGGGNEHTVGLVLSPAHPASELVERQAYIICPAVEDNPDAALPGEESPALNLKAVKTYAETLQKEIGPG